MFFHMYVVFRQNHVYFNKISFHFLLSLEAFSNNRELLSTTDKMSGKLHG